MSSMSWAVNIVHITSLAKIALLERTHAEVIQSTVSCVLNEILAYGGQYKNGKNLPGHRLFVHIESLHALDRTHTKFSFGFIVTKVTESRRVDLGSDNSMTHRKNCVDCRMLYTVLYVSSKR